MIQKIRLSDLHPHPQNPRLMPHEETVAQIAASLERDGFDEAHALIVRKKGKVYEIVSGHHRVLAAKRAGLKEVPCWIRDLSDEDAYMMLVLDNAQASLHPLEIGLHALRSGLTQRAYADRIGMTDGTLQNRWEAAQVVDFVGKSCSDIPANELRGKWGHICELHPAPKWMWKVLLKHLLEQEWTVDAIRKIVKGLTDAQEPPAWMDSETVAGKLVAGTLRVSDLKSLAQTVDSARKEIAEIARKFEDSLASLGEKDQEKFLTAFQDLPDLDKELSKKKPSSISDASSLCRSVRMPFEDLFQQVEGARIKVLQEKESDAERTVKWRKHVSLDDWKEMDGKTRKAILSMRPEQDEAVPSFNAQTTADIEWAQWSWNPITGCLHDCPYCYARDIAHQARMKDTYPFGFAPTLRPMHLFAPQQMKLPKEASKDTRFKNVFTGSMSDMFGRWVPEEWITAVLESISKAPEWNFLCLTKFPKRMTEFALPKNMWMGTTVDLQARVANAEKAFAKVKALVKWLSVEPMLEPLKFSRLDLFDWIVIGGASSSTKTPEWRPPFAWIYDLVRQAREADVRVYFKTNLLGNPERILELPFDAPIPREETELAEVFQYLGRAKTPDQKGESPTT